MHKHFHYFSIKYLHLNIYTDISIPYFLGQFYIARLSSNSLCSRGWPNSTSSCLHLPSAGIAGVPHHCLHLIISYSSLWKSEMYRGLPLHSLTLRLSHRSLDTAEAWCQSLFPWKNLRRKDENHIGYAEAQSFQIDFWSRAAQTHHKCLFILELKPVFMGLGLT